MQSGAAELHEAAARGDLAAVNALLDRGVDVNARQKVTAYALRSALFVSLRLLFGLTAASCSRHRIKPRRCTPQQSTATWKSCSASTSAARGSMLATRCVSCDECVAARRSTQCLCCCCWFAAGRIHSAVWGGEVRTRPGAQVPAEAEEGQCERLEQGRASRLRALRWASRSCLRLRCLVCRTSRLTLKPATQRSASASARGAPRTRKASHDPSTNG